ncbi:MAG: DUF4332 domain-containing protein [Chloroflexota bacterium]|jgi:hypothetical protein
MAYHIDAINISLDDLRERIEATDLIPSRASLTDKIREKMNALEEQGIVTLASLRDELKNSKRLATMSEKTGIDTQYLILLRREIQGYFPKPVALKVFDWLPKDEIVKLEQNEIGDTATLYEMTSSAKKRLELAKSTGVNSATLEILAQLADLMRVQWVSATFAWMLIVAGYDSVDKVAAANANNLCEALARINAGDRFFKGKIGLRDTKRLIQAASYV